METLVLQPPCWDRLVSLCHDRETDQCCRRGHERRNQIGWRKVGYFETAPKKAKIGTSVKTHGHCNLNASHRFLPLQSSLSEEKPWAQSLGLSYRGRQVLRALGGNPSIKAFFGKCEEHEDVGEAGGLLLPSVVIYASTEVLRLGKFYKNSTVLLYIIMRKEMCVGEQFLESRMRKRLNIFLWDAKRNKIDQKLVKGGWQWNGGTVCSRLCHFLARWQGANDITVRCLVFLMGKMGIIMIKDLPSRVVSAISESCVAPGT